MVATAAEAARPRRTGPRRGGNRLTPDRYPLRGPSYGRSRAFSDDRERRDRNQRNRARRAVSWALARAELSPVLAVVLHQLLDHCKDTLLEPAPDGGPACSGWWSLAYIHDLVHPHIADEDGSDEQIGQEDLDGQDETSTPPGARTAGRWMARLADLGWVEKIHRHRLVNGEQWGTSNLWRIQIPAHLRQELHAGEDAARAARSPGRRPKSRPPGHHPLRAPAVRPVRDTFHREHGPCPACEGTRWVESPKGGGMVRCTTCDGSGARAGP